MKLQPHRTDEQTAAYINLMIAPQDLKISRLVIKNQVNKNGEAIVYIRLRRYEPSKKKDFKEKRIATGVVVKPKSWSTKKGRVLPSDFEHIHKNRKIQEKETQIRNYTSQPDLDYIFAQLSKEEFLKIEEVFPSAKMLKFKKSLFDYIDDYQKRRVELGHKRDTTKEYITLMNRIKNFDDNKRFQKTYLTDINISWSDNFEMWMNSINYGSGTIEKTYTLLVAVLNHYWEIKEEQKIIMNDKFKSKLFKRGKPSRNKPHPINEQQLMCLYHHKFNDKYFSKIKQMILFQCFTGVRFGDLATLRPHNIINNYLMFTPKKTERYDVTVEQPLNEYAKEILNEIGNDTSILKMENQPYNREIKELFKLLQVVYPKLNFDNDYTSHNFRDTFISLAVAKGINWKSILKWVGQSSYKIMDRYIELSRPFDSAEMKKMFG